MCQYTLSMLHSSRRPLAFAASVFLNDIFLGTTNGSASVEQTNALYAFPAGAVKLGTDNVVTVIQVRFQAAAVAVLAS